MQALAITSHLLHYGAAIVGIGCCVTLFRRGRAWGWLMVSGLFVEPFVQLLMRAFRGDALLAYRTVSAGAEGILDVTYHMQFRPLFLIAVAGLLLLVWRSRGAMGESGRCDQTQPVERNP